MTETKKKQDGYNEVYETLSLEDFDNPEFCKTFLAAHKAEMERTEPHERIDFGDYYTLYWDKGFMQATPADRGLEIANLWGCVFIWLWMYKGLDVKDVDSLCHGYTFMITEITKKKGQK